jgi:hypothetical protein
MNHAGVASCGWQDMPEHLQEALKHLQTHGCLKFWAFRQQKYSTVEAFDAAVWQAQPIPVMERLLAKEGSKVAARRAGLSAEYDAGTEAGVTVSLDSSGSISISGIAPDAVELQAHLAKVCASLEQQFRGQPTNLEFGLQEHRAFWDRMSMLCDSVDECIESAALKRATHRAAHGPGSSWAAAGISGFSSAQHARLLDAASNMVQHLAQEHQALQQALLHPVA